VPCSRQRLQYIRRRHLDRGSHRRSCSPRAPRHRRAGHARPQWETRTCRSARRPRLSPAYRQDGASAWTCQPLGEAKESIARTSRSKRRPRGRVVGRRLRYPFPNRPRGTTHPETGHLFGVHRRAHRAAQDDRAQATPKPVIRTTRPSSPPVRGSTRVCIRRDLTGQAARVHRGLAEIRPVRLVRDAACQLRQHCRTSTGTSAHPDCPVSCYARSRWRVGRAW
jgi:hypothetical protein